MLRAPCPPLLLVALAVLPLGCEDAREDPFGSVLTEETHGALHLQTRLPAPDEWEDLPVSDSTAGLEAWANSWKLRTSEGRAARETAYDTLVPALAEYLPRGEVRSGLDRLTMALNEAERLSEDELPERITRRLALARDAQLRGDLALERGDTLLALEELVRGTDLLREVEPPQVAAELISIAQEGMRRLLASETYSEQKRERAQSLLRIARTAVQDGDFTRAIQSAYYATRLLDMDVE